MALAGCAFALALAGCGAEKSGCVIDDDCPSGDVCVVGACRPLAGADLSGVSQSIWARAPTWPPPSPTAGTRTRSPRRAASTATAPSRAPRSRSWSAWARSSRSTRPDTPSPSTMSRRTGPGTFPRAVSGEAKQFDQLVDPERSMVGGRLPYRHLRRAHRRRAAGIWSVSRQRRQVGDARRRQRPEHDSPSTELTYTTPIVVLQFPLSVGTTWTSESDVSGTATVSPSSPTRSTSSPSASAARPRCRRRASIRSASRCRIPRPTGRW